MAATGSRDVRVGEWSLALAPGGSIARVAHRGDVVLDGVAVIVRDDVWGTVPAETRVTVDELADRVVVRISARHARAGAAAVREDELRLDAGGVLVRTRVTVEGGPFDTNRIGVVLLHPLDLAGSPVRIRHGDDRVEDGAFPVEVSPHQPFLDVRGFEHATASGATVRIELAGDTFETEDQRNWSDASYKTYSRPLALPFPYRVRPGEAIEQSVRISAPEPSDARLTRDRAPLESGAPSRPAIGVCLGPDDDPETSAAWARELGLDHVRVDVEATSAGLRGRDRLVAISPTRLPVELAVHVGADPARALDELAAMIDEHAPRIAAIAVFDAAAPATTARALGAVRAALGDALAPFLVGTDDNFAELNRNRPDPAWQVAATTFSLTPQVHAYDDESVLATVASFDAILRTARRLGPATAIGALTLRPRRNIYVRGGIDRLARDPSAADPRQFTAFAADWLTASLRALRDGGVARVTTLEFTGPRGLVEPASASLAPVGRALAAFLEEIR